MGFFLLSEINFESFDVDLRQYSSIVNSQSSEAIANVISFTAICWISQILIEA